MTQKDAQTYTQSKHIDSMGGLQQERMTGEVVQTQNVLLSHNLLSGAFIVRDVKHKHTTLIWLSIVVHWSEAD